MTLAAVALGGCVNPVAPKFRAEAAVLADDSEPGAIILPDSVARGVAFDVKVRTYAGGCTRSVARTDVSIVGSVVEIRPFNLADMEVGVVCPSDGITLQHSVSITLPAAGRATVRVIGVKLARTLSAPVATTLERIITVR